MKHIEREIDTHLKLNHNKLGLPKNIYNEFENIWEVKTWYEILGFNNYIVIS